MTQKTLSVIISVNNESEMIQKNIERVTTILKNSKINYELILIDDGSKDSSWSKIKDSAQMIPGIKAIKLSRNFGKESALCAGLDLATGDCCVCIDADMQHPPEIIPQMYQLWENEGYDIVEGVKKIEAKKV